MNSFNLNPKALISEISQDLKALADKNQLQVGFFETSKYQNGLFVADVAKNNEFGTLQIPSRPFFRNAIENNHKKWINFLAQDLVKSENAEISYNRLGEVARGDIVKSINQTNSPANSPLTIEAKSSSKPLVDTGFLRANVTFKVEK
mgnify:FL=1